MFILCLLYIYVYIVIKFLLLNYQHGFWHCLRTCASQIHSLDYLIAIDVLLMF